MSEFPRVDDTVRVERTSVAEAAREELVHAGLPLRPEDDLTGPGFDIEVDLGDDEAGGVFVTWHADSSITQAAVQSVAQGRLDDAVVQRSGVMSQAMRDAMIAILNAGGFIAVLSDDDMRPLALRVVSSPIIGALDE
jgi:hypothetical protein